jgi:hypothetical protein
MPLPLWECPGCGKTVRADALCGDDWGGVEVAQGPECEECDEYMDLIEEASGD